MAALPGAGGMGLLVGGAVRGPLWSAEDLVTGLDLDVFEPLVGSSRWGTEVSSLLSMMVMLSSQVTDFVCFGGGVSSTVSTV